MLRFRQIADSVSAYVRNLNTHAAYAEFRRARAAMRGAGRPLDGFGLAATLGRYSERGDAYIQDIRGIIRQNRLERFRNAALMARTCRAPGDGAAARRALLARIPRC